MGSRHTFIVVTLLAILSNLNPLFAGNHEIIHPSLGYSIGWENPEAIPYWTDKGSLGRLSNAQAKALIRAMMDVWSSVETANVGFEYMGDLPEDVTEDNFADYLNMTSCGNSDRTDIPNDVVPIVFDENGKLLEYITGAGSSAEIGGLATLRCFIGRIDNPGYIHQGMVILNGQFIDDKGSEADSPTDLGTNGVAGVMLHELGHLIGLDHSALNEEIYDSIYAGLKPASYSRYLPVMLPTVLRNSNSSTTLRPDDISSISTLHPAEDYLSSVGKISGQILSSDGIGIRKANVIARRKDDPLCEAVSTLSGRRCVPLVDSSGNPNFNMSNCSSNDMLGDYIIEGLTPGEYTVEVEELEAGWIRKGMFPESLNKDLPGDAEFYNLYDEMDESPYTFTLVTASEGNLTEDIDIVLSSNEAASSQLDRIPLTKFTEGPGTRCTQDAIDYESWVAGITDDEALPPDSQGGEGAGVAEGDTEVGGGGGGCQLNRAVDSKWGIIMFVSIVGLLFWRRKRHYLTVVLLVFMFLSPSVSSASSIIPSTLEQMSLKAGKIFYGKCVGTEVQKDENGLVSTLVTYKIIRGVKDTPGDAVTFKVFGVATENTSSEPATISGMPSFEAGREDVLFLYKESPWGFTSPIGLWQGDFTVVETEDGPRLSDTKGLYLQTAGKTSATKVKSAEMLKNPVVTPDDLLDTVEDILKR